MKTRLPLHLIPFATAAFIVTTLFSGTSALGKDIPAGSQETYSESRIISDSYSGAGTLKLNGNNNALFILCGDNTDVNVLVEGKQRVMLSSPIGGGKSITFDNVETLFYFNSIKKERTLDALKFVQGANNNVLSNFNNLAQGEGWDDALGTVQKYYRTTLTNTALTIKGAMHTAGITFGTGAILTFEGNQAWTVGTNTLYSKGDKLETADVTILNAGSQINIYDVFLNNGTYKYGYLQVNGGKIVASHDFKIAYGNKNDDASRMELSSGEVSVGGWFIVGAGGKGFFDMSGGKLTTVNNCVLGEGTTGHGTVNMSGGDWKSAPLRIGLNGTGIFNMTNGTVTADNLWVGEGTNGIGTLNINGGKINAIANGYIGRGGKGTVVVNNGIFTLNNGAPDGRLYLGYDEGSTGELIIKGGEVKTWGLFISSANGTGGNGKVTVDGGKLTVTDVLWMGNAKGTSELIQTGGTISVSMLTLLGRTAGNESISTMRLNKGTADFQNDFFVGNDSKGKLVVDGGSARVNGWTVVGYNVGEGFMEVKSGEFNANGHLTIGGSWNSPSSSKGTLDMTGGTINTTGLGNFPSFTVGEAGTGVANISGGNINLNINSNHDGGHFLIGKNESGIGTLNMSAGTITINSNGSDSGNFYIGYAGQATVNQSGGTIIIHGKTIQFGNTNNKAIVNLLGGKWIAEGTTNWSKINADLTFGDFSYYVTGDQTITDEIDVTLAEGGVFILGSAAIAGADATLTWEGLLSGKGGLGSDDGILAIITNSANSYTGPTVAKGGTLQAGNNNVFSIGSLVVEDDGILDLNHKTLANKDIILKGGTLINIDTTATGETSLAGKLRVETEKSDTLNVIKIQDATLSATSAPTLVDRLSVHVDYNNQLYLENTHLTLGATGQNNILNFVLGDNNIIDEQNGPGIAVVTMDRASTLTLAGTLNLDLSLTQNIDWSTYSATFTLLGMGDFSNFKTWSESGGLNLTQFEGVLLTPSALSPDDTVVRWRPTQDLAGIKSELSEKGTITLEALPCTFTYVSAGELAYEYILNGQYYGSKVDGLNFTKEFAIADGIDAVYGFSLFDDPNTDGKAYSFTVSSEIKDSLGRKSTVDIRGRADEERRTLTLANVKNSFTGDIFVTEAILRTESTNATAGSITILGKNNTVHLNSGSSLELATGNESYTYANNLNFTASDTSVINISGTNTFTGKVSTRLEGILTFENQSDGALKFLGTFTDNQKTTTLVLNSTKGDIILGGDNSNIAQIVINGKLTLGDNPGKMATLSTNGLTINSGNLTLNNGQLTLGAQGLTVKTMGTQINFENNAQLNLNAAYTVDNKLTLNIATGSQSIIQSNYDLEINGRLQGSGNLEKKGSGSLILGGNPSFSGELKVSQGSLIINPNVDFTPSSLVMGKDTTLQLKGSLNVEKGIQMQQGSRFQGVAESNHFDITFDQNAIHEGLILDHTGDITFRAGSQLKTQVDYPNTVTKGVVITQNNSGSTINLQGLTIHGSAINDKDWKVLETATFTLMYADGGFLGKDVQLANNKWNNFLNGVLVFDGKNLNVELTRNAEKITPYTQTSNQYNVAEVMDDIVNNMGTMNLGGTPLGYVANMFAEMDLASEAPQVLDMVAGLNNYQLIAGQRTDLLRHVEAVRQRALQSKGLLEMYTSSKSDFWIEGTQSYYRQDSTTNAPGYKHISWGGATGADLVTNKNFILGIGLAYSNIETTSDMYQGKVSTDAYYIDLYSRYEKGSWVSTFVITAGMTTSDIERSITGLDKADGKSSVSADGTSFIAQGELGYNIPVDEYGQSFMPIISLTLGTIDTDSYTENGMGNLGLNVAPDTLSIAQIAVGFRYQDQVIDTYMECESSRIELRALIVQDFGDGNYTTSSKFIGAPTMSFQTSGVPIVRTAFVVGAGFNQALDQDWSWFGDINGEFREKNCGMNASLGLRCTF